MIVSDTNLIVHLYVESDHSHLARDLMLREVEWSAPAVWRSEFRSALSTIVRGRRLELDDALRIMDAAESMMRDNESEVPSDDVIRLAAETGCSACDAEFVVLARDLRVPLVTTDQELLEKFHDTAVSPEDFLARR